MRPTSQPPPLHPIHLANTGTGISLEALLNPPFNHLTNHDLHHTARHNQPRQNGGDSGHGTKPASTQRKTPTQQGRRSQPSNTTSNHDPHDAGSYKNLVVPPLGFEPRTMCLSGTHEV